MGLWLLFEFNKGGARLLLRGDYLFSFTHISTLSDWVIQKAMEINHCVGITCEGFEDEFMVLLIVIGAGYAQFKSDPSLYSTKKKEKENSRGLRGP